MHAKVWLLWLCVMLLASCAAPILEGPHAISVEPKNVVWINEPGEVTVCVTMFTINPFYTFKCTSVSQLQQWLLANAAN